MHWTSAHSIHSSPSCDTVQQAAHPRSTPLLRRAADPPLALVHSFVSPRCSAFDRGTKHKHTLDETSLTIRPRARRRLTVRCIRRGPRACRCRGERWSGIRHPTSIVAGLDRSTSMQFERLRAGVQGKQWSGRGGSCGDDASAFECSDGIRNGAPSPPSHSPPHPPPPRTAAVPLPFHRLSTQCAAAVPQSTLRAMPRSQRSSRPTSASPSSWFDIIGGCQWNRIRGRWSCSQIELALGRSLLVLCSRALAPCACDVASTVPRPGASLVCSRPATGLRICCPSFPAFGSPPVAPP